MNVLSALLMLHTEERGEVSWKWFAIGAVVGAAIVLLLAVGGLIKFLIPGE